MSDCSQHLPWHLPEAAQKSTLAAYDLIDGDRDPALDRLLALVAQATRMPIAVLTLWDGQHYRMQSGVGLCRSRFERVRPILRAVRQDAPVTLAGPEAAGSELRFGAGAPLFSPEGWHLGALVIADPDQRPDFGPAEAEVLADCARLAMDVLERRRETRRLRADLDSHRRNEDRLAFALEAAEEGLWDWHLPSGSCYWSPRHQGMLGHLPSGLTGHYDRWHAAIHPEDRARVLDAIWAHAEGRRPGYEIEYRLRAADDRWIWVLDRGTVVERDADGRAIRMVGSQLDISARKAAEAEVGRAAARIRDVLESTSDCVVAIDADRHVRYMNRRAKTLLGARDPLDRALPDLFADAESFESELDRAFAASRPVAFEIYAAHLERWLGINLYPSEEGLAIYFRDVTERRQLKDKLQAKTASFQLLFEANPVPMMVYDRESLRILEVNAAAVEGYGYERDRFLAMTVLDIRPPEDHDWFRQTAARDPDTYRPGRLARHLKANGEILWVEVSAHAIPFAGRDAALVACVDVTERIDAQSMREASEAALRRLLRERTAMLDALPAQVALVDSEGRIVATNKSWSAVSDACHPASSGAVVEDGYRCVPPTACGEMAPLASRGLRAVLAGERTETGFEYACDGHGPDGGSDRQGRRWFRYSATAIDPTRRAGAVVMHIDVTESKRAQEEIERARIRAEEANRTKSEFLANMSHELRTPLNAIIGFSEIMKAEMFGPLGAACYRQYAADIHGSGTHLLSLVNDILDVSRVDIGRLELRIEPIEAPDVIRSCATLVGGRAREAEVALSVELEADLPAIRADVVRLKQILVNLLSNAIKFTPAGGQVRLTAARTRNAPIGDAVAFEIADTGIGMTDEQLRFALQPFCQVDNSLARRHDGAGLGLPLAKGLVELHDGRLEVESRPGRGTRARVLLPIAGEPPAAEADDRTALLTERVA